MSLRATHKKMFLSGQLKDIYGGRYQVLPSRLLSAVLPPVAGYASWYDAADTSTITLSGSNVTVWADKGSGAFNLTPGTSPTYTSRTINGITVIEFDGTTMRLNSNCPTDDNHSTWFFVGLGDSMSVLRNLIGASASSGFHVYSSATRNLGFESQLSAAIFESTLKPTAAVAFQCTIMQDSGASPACWIGLNGTSQTANGTTFSYTAPRTLTLGPTGTGTQFWDGLIAEIIYYSTSLGSSDIALVESYLKGKWGTP